jgi:hypothetical protein
MFFSFPPFDHDDQETVSRKKEVPSLGEDVQHVYQDIEADNPMEAIEIAEHERDDWEQCDVHDWNGIRIISNEVHDLATDEFIPVHGARKCSTCGRNHAHDDLVRIARSAANAFEERISCLRDELKDAIDDHDDINDQIANYQHLLDEHRRFLADQH